MKPATEMRVKRWGEAMKKRMTSRALKKLLIVGALLSAGGGFIYWLSPRLFFGLVNAAGMALMVLSAVTMMISYRKAKAVAPRSLILSMGISLLSAVVLATLSSAWPGWLFPGLSLFFGSILGAGWGLTTDLFTEGATVRSRGNGWYLVVWILSLMVTQVIPMATGRTPLVGTVLLFGGAGLVLGNSGIVLLRYRLLKAGVAQKLRTS